MPPTKTGRMVLSKQRPTGLRPLPKYRAIPTLVDGIRFDSRKEAERYSMLRLLERNGEISNLQLQVSYPIIVSGQKICTYRADFVYADEVTGQVVVEDVKGMVTPVYRLKKKLMLAVYGISIQEV